MSDTNKHAVLSPSGATRWMQCPGSAAMEKGKPDSSNEYSDEGTCAHAVAAMCLTEGKPATAYIGRRIEVGTCRTYEFREDMAEPVETYVQNIFGYARPSIDGRTFQQHEMHVEVEVPIGHITGEQDATGTSDVVIITADQEEIQVHDLKFGRGVAVDATNNKQMMLYALGALAKFDVLGEFKRVRCVIHQPRINNAPSEWECTTDELRQFEQHAKERAFHALQVYNDEVPEALIHHLKPSEDACRFCKAKAECPALSKFVVDAVGQDFEVLSTARTDPIAEEQVTLEMSPQGLDAPELSAKMAACDLIEDWIKAVRAAVERSLLAGEQVPGYKLVQGRQGDRAWRDGVEAEALLKSFRLKQEEMYSLKLKGPKPIEDLLKRASPKRWKKAEAIITRSPGSPSVAPVSDKRPALVVTPTADDFGVVEETYEDLA